MTRLTLLPSQLLIATLLFVLGLFASAATAQEKWFTQDSLNAGLGPPPPMIDRETPMASMESFLHLTEKGDFDAAAHLLDLSDVPVSEQAEAGRERAELLSVIIERKVLVPWSSLADRPDGWLAGDGKDGRSGRLRRSISIDTLELDSRRVPIRLNRVKAGKDAAPVWVFSSATVENVPALFRAYGPTEIEKNLPDWARATSLFGMYVWELLFLPLVLLIAAAIAPVVYKTLDRLGKRERPQWVAIAARSLKWPATITIFAAIISVTTNHLLVVTGIVDTYLGPIVIVAYVVSFTLAIVLIIDEIFEKISKSNPNELADPDNAHLRSMATTISAARKFVIVIAVLVAGGVALSSIDTLHTFGFSLLASAGALTLILGFAAREVLGNILASVQIALNRSARIGDQLVFEGQFVTVERIYFTYVQLMVWNSTRLIVPVSHFVEDAFINFSIEDPAMVRPIELTLAQTADIDAMRRIFFDLIDQEDQDDLSPREKAKVHVLGQDVFGLKVRFELPTANPETFWEMECRVRERLLKAAQELQKDSDDPVLPPLPDDKPEA